MTKSYLYFSLKQFYPRKQINHFRGEFKNGPSLDSCNILPGGSLQWPALDLITNQAYNPYLNWALAQTVTVLHIFTLVVQRSGIRSVHRQTTLRTGHLLPLNLILEGEARLFTCSINLQVTAIYGISRRPILGRCRGEINKLCSSRGGRVYE